MLSIDLVRAMTDERERDIRERLRVWRLLDAARTARESEAAAGGARGYKVAWRASAPRASATTR
jgi:hypothetical protein